MMTLNLIVFLNILYFVSFEMEMTTGVQIRHMAKLIVRIEAQTAIGKTESIGSIPPQALYK